MDRRSLIVRGLGAAVTLAPGFRLLAQAEAPRDGGRDPHFFLQIVMTGGVDPTYLFDARPLKLTDKGKLCNYVYKNDATGAELLTGERAAPKTLANKREGGDTALYGPLAEPLLKFRDQFAVLNGVCMLLDGSVSHGQNLYFLSNGASVNGDSYLPYIGQRSGSPLESLHIGSTLFRPFEGDGNTAPSNFAGSVVLAYGIGGRLGADLKAGVNLDLDQRAVKYALERYEANKSAGMFGQGIEKLLSGIRQGPRLATAMQAMKAPPGAPPSPMMGGMREPNKPEWGDMKDNLDLAFLYMNSGATSAATVMVDGDPFLDTHDEKEAQRTVALYKGLVGELVKLFEYLNDPSKGPGGRKLIDCTTVLITSEFSRTMVKADGGTFESIGKSGTDHNPLNNFVLLAGKGIQGGTIFGASDMQDCDDRGELKDVSAAHRRLDADSKRIMGRPFDFTNGKAITDLTGDLKPERQLTMNSVVNTMLSLYGVDQQKWRNVRASDDRTIKAPVLTHVLKG